MNIVIPRHDLLRLLATCHGVAHGAVKPVMPCVVLDAKGNSLHMAATDHHTFVSDATVAEVTLPGSLAMRANQFAWVVSMMPPGPIHIESAGEGRAAVSVLGVPRRVVLDTFDGNDFAKAPMIEGHGVDLPLAPFAKMLDRTAFAICHDKTRPNINSLCVEWSAGKLRTTATDGHRIATSVRAPSAACADHIALVPRSSVMELQKLLLRAIGRGATSMRVTSDHFWMRFSAGGMTLTTKLVDAAFPDWRHVVPETYKTTLLAPRTALMDAVSSMVVANDPCEDWGLRSWSPTTKLPAWKERDRYEKCVRISVEAGTLRVSPTVGIGHDELAVSQEGPSFDLGFCAGYLLDALSAVDGDEVLMRVNGEIHDPVRVSAPGDDTAFTIMMPARA